MREANKVKQTNIIISNKCDKCDKIKKGGVKQDD